MKRVYFATTNKGKVETVGDTLQKYGIEMMHAHLDLPELQTDDLRAIASGKALHAYEKIKKPCITLDAGFYVHSLKGFPRAMTKFVLDTIGISGILRLVDDNDRRCEFRNCLAYYDGYTAAPICFESKIPGIIARSPGGGEEKYSWSELSRIFIPEGETKTLAEMTKEEYWLWREKRSDESAAWKFAKWYLNYKPIQLFSS